MKYILPALILLTSCHSKTEEVSWFVGSWIADPELTISQNEHLADLSQQRIESVRNMLSGLRWEATTSTLTVIRLDNEDEASFEYTVEPISESEFNFVDASAGGMTIRKIGNGICADYHSTSGSSPLLVSECFARYDS